MKNRALVLIDIQNDYFPGGKWTLPDIESASTNASRILELSRNRNEKIFHVRHEFLGSDAPFFLKDSPGAHIHDSVAPIDGESVILKHSPNAFKDTDLKIKLEKDGIEELTIVGAMSQVCIDASVRAASDFGFKVTLIHDACAAKETEFNGTSVPANQVHASFMASLGFAYATLNSTNEFIEKQV